MLSNSLVQFTNVNYWPGFFGNLSVPHAHYMIPQEADPATVDSLYQDLLLLEFKEWFKTDFFRWMDAPKCSRYRNKWPILKSKVLYVEVFWMNRLMRPGRGVRRGLILILSNILTQVWTSSMVFSFWAIFSSRIHIKSSRISQN